MKIKMQYPNIKNNKLCDGKIHTINPFALNKIEGVELYLLDYFDENYGCECSTILIKTKDEFKKVPLLDYNQLFEMLENEQLNLIPIDIFELIINNKNLFIKSEEPKKDITIPLKQARAAIIIYIDENGDLYINIGNGFEKINEAQLSAIMQQYDIEWRNKNNNSLASPDSINSAINKNLGHEKGITVKEKYKIDNIHHYSVGYYYKDEKGFIRGHQSI